MPRSLTDVVREPLGAQAAVFALLLDPDESVRRAQLAWLDAYSLPAAVRETRKIQADAQRLAPEARLPLVELAAPALCQMTPAQFHDFFRSVEALVQADHKMTLFEYALQRLLIRHVVTHFVRSKPPSVKYTTFPPLAWPTSRGAVGAGCAGEATPDGAARAFAAGVEGPGLARCTTRAGPGGHASGSGRSTPPWKCSPRRPRHSRSRSWRRVPPASASMAP